MWHVSTIYCHEQFIHYTKFKTDVYTYINCRSLPSEHVRATIRGQHSCHLFQLMLVLVNGKKICLEIQQMERFGFENTPSFHEPQIA